MTKYPKEGWYGPNVLQVILLPVVVAVVLFLFGCASSPTPQPPTVTAPIYTLEPVTPDAPTPQPTEVGEVQLPCPGAVVIDAHRVCFVEVMAESPEYDLDGNSTGFVFLPAQGDEAADGIVIDLTDSEGNHCLLWQTKTTYVLCETVRYKE